MHGEDRSSALERIHGEIWRDLCLAASHPESAYRWMTLATSSSDGAPELRTVVVRLVDRERMTLSFFTDQRSTKWLQICRSGPVALLCLKKHPLVQIRLLGMADFASSGEAISIWHDQHLGIQQQYYSRISPGRALKFVGELAVTPKTSTIEAISNFSVIHVKVHTIDWLSIDKSEGDRRAEFTYGSGEVEARWLVP